MVVHRYAIGLFLILHATSLGAVSQPIIPYDDHHDFFHDDFHDEMDPYISDVSDYDCDNGYGFPSMTYREKNGMEHMRLKIGLTDQHMSFVNPAKVVHIPGKVERLYYHSPSKTVTIPAKYRTVDVRVPAAMIHIRAKARVFRVVTPAHDVTIPAKHRSILVATPAKRILVPGKTTEIKVEQPPGQVVLPAERKFVSVHRKNQKVSLLTPVKIIYAAEHKHHQIHLPSVRVRQRTWSHPWYGRPFPWYGKRFPLYGGGQEHGLDDHHVFPNDHPVFPDVHPVFPDDHPVFPIPWTPGHSSPFHDPVGSNVVDAPCMGSQCMSGRRKRQEDDMIEEEHGGRHEPGPILEPEEPAIAYPKSDYFPRVKRQGKMTSVKCLKSCQCAKVCKCPAKSVYDYDCLSGRCVCKKHP